MNTTSVYGLNQWVSSDRILMSDFNSDNQKLETALTALAADIAQRATQTALEAARQEAASAVAAAKQEAANAVAAAKQEAAAAVAAAKQEAANAVAAARAEHQLVKLGTIVIGTSAAQVDLDFSTIHLSDYSEIMIYPYIRTGTSNVGNDIMIRFNNLTSGYMQGLSGDNEGYLARYTSPSTVTLHLVASNGNLCCWSSLCNPYSSGGIMEASRIKPEVLSPENLTSINFISTVSGDPILSGGKITIYGVRA